MAPTIRPSLIAALVAAGLLGGCEAPLATEHAGIINGEPIPSAEFPAAGQLIFSGTYRMGPQQMPLTVPICSATLVAPDVVLTAGHCVDAMLITGGQGWVEDARYCITFEEDQTWMMEPQYQYNAPLPDDAVCSTGFVQHPQFDVMALQTAGNGLGNLFDLALVFLDTPVTDRPFAYMPTGGEGSQLVAGMSVDIVGYGQRSIEQDPWNPDPDDANQRYWAQTTLNEVGSWEMQVGSNAASGHKCHGDSGGPTFAVVDTTLVESERVIGVTSRAYNVQVDCGMGGIDTRVDPHEAWIDDAFRDACQQGLRSECDDPGVPVPDEASGDDDDDDGGDDDDAADDDAAGDDDATGDDDDDDDCGADADDDDDACDCPESGGCALAVAPRRVSASMPWLAVFVGVIAWLRLHRR